MIKNPSHYAHPFGSVAERMAQALREREQRAEFYKSTHEIVSRAFNTPDATTLAAAIIRAGMKRRNELQEPPQFSNDVHGKRAKAIVNAGRRARNEEPI